MFISSMARINKDKRLKNAHKLRKSEERKLQRSINIVENSYDEDSGNPPRSSVSKSDFISVNGSGKKLQRIRDSKNLSNSAKTIRLSNTCTNTTLPPNSKVKLGTISPPIDHVDDGSLISDTPRHIYNSKLPRSISENVKSDLEDFKNKQTLLSLIDDNPSDADPWYLDTDTVRRKAAYSSQSLADSYNIRSDKYAGISFLDIDSENEKSNITLKGLRDLMTKSVTPYELQLCRLRQNKLRMEESHILKMKCNSELERTRGPKPKWYELKTKEFTEEMEKYDNIMSNRKNWNQLVDYRSNLFETSRRLSNLRF